jgi:AraC family transcriptional regulator
MTTQIDTDNLTCEVRKFDPGRTEIPPLPYALLIMHLSKPNSVTCRRDGRIYTGTELRGDIDLIPAGMPSLWESRMPGASLLLRVPTPLLANVGLECGLEADAIRLNSRFCMRDQQIEHLGLALKYEIESGSPGGRLFREALGTALAVQLLRRHRMNPSELRNVSEHRTSHAKFRKALSYIESHLDADLGLAELAQVACMSMSHLKAVFRREMGLSVHQYVLKRRVELAERLLTETSMPIREVALEAGFAHQSHLTMHLARLRGTTPSRIRRR